jgi:class 3 adenylate cyclase
VLTCPRCGQENPDGARFCNACAAPLVAAAPVAREERKVVSVLFCDLVGFTARAERLDPEDVRALLAPYHQRLRAELERHGGTVEKFIGDAVMALFGAPVAHEDDPERAVRAALAIRDAIVEQGELQVRIGITTGEALVSLEARPEAGEGMASGDVVNVAARLESAAPVNGVLVDAATARATDGVITFRPAAPVEAKGKSEPVPAWEAVEPVASFGIDVEVSARTPLIGRSRELELLVSLLARVRHERSPQLLTLVGVPGIGKSRLVYELSQTAERDADLIRWRQGRCLPYGEGVAFWALGEIVKAQAGVFETDGAGEVERKLHGAVAGLIADPTEARWVQRELLPLAGVATDGAGAEPASAWRRFIEAMAEDGPTVLVVEDLHWADDGLLDFVEELVEWLRDVPLLVVATARPELLERRPTWGGGKANVTTMSLAPLHDEDTAALLAELLGRPVQLASEQRALLERAGGNPLFAEQYVRMLAEQGDQDALPGSLQAIMAARLDALSGPEKRLLQDASVHGKVFWLGAVAAATGAQPSDAERLLRSLERKEFVRRERRSAVAGDAQYSFGHALLRDVAYSQIPRRARAEKHRGAAEWLERLGRPDDHAQMLAHQYRQALELARAAGVGDDPALVRRTWESLRDAGQRSWALAAYDAAAEFFTAAHALCPPDEPARPRLVVAESRARFETQEIDMPALDRAFHELVAIGDVEGAAEAATVAARAFWFAGDRAATDRYAARALELTADRPRSRARAMAMTGQSGFLMLGGDFEESLELGTRALPLVEELGLDDQRARLHIVLGTARCCTGDDGGLQQIEEGIEIASATGAVNMVEVGYANLCSELCFLGRLNEARIAWRQGFDLAERYGIARMVLDGRLERATWAFVDGHWDDALQELDDLVSASRSRDNSDPLVLAVRATIRLARGDVQGARADSASAVEMARLADAQPQSRAYTVAAAVALEEGRLDEANAFATDLVAIGPVLLPALGSPAPTLADVAWVFRDLGREADLMTILDSTPIDSPWMDAARAIAAGELARAADIIEGMGHAAGAAYARRRAGDLDAADPFCRAAGATAWLRREAA